MTAEAQAYINKLLSEFRHLVVDIEEERRDLRKKIRELPIVAAAISNNQSSTTTTRTTTTSSRSTRNTLPTPSADSLTLPSTITLSSGSLSTNTVTTNGSTRPPPYRATTLKPISSNHNHHHHHHSDNTSSEQPPQAPARTKRRGHGNKSNDNNNNYSSIRNTSYENLMSRIMSAANLTRGSLIVLEGLDRVGKSTLAKKLVEHLEHLKQSVVYHRFPDRTTPTGKVIHDFLTSKSKQVDDHTMHLLFSANRWELNKTIRQTLLQGTTIIVDRYSYSGIAYSCAKKGLSLDWCKQSEKGLPKPDLVIYLELTGESQDSRPGFGDERFETRELQDKVRLQYERIMDISQDNWLRIDVESKSPDQVLGEVLGVVKHCIDSSANKIIGNLDFL